MLPLVAFLLPALILFLGFAVDLAYMQNTRLELRAVTDAAARAAASTLSATDDKALARQAAKRIARRNSVAGESLLLRNSDIEFGRSEPDKKGSYAFVSGGTPTNSVRVLGDRTPGSRTGTVPLFFGKLVGSHDFQPVLTSTATFLNVDICLVLDRSTSMKADVDATESGMYTNDPLFCQPPGPNTRWVALDSAVKVFTNTLRDTNAEEQVGLATYSSAYSPVVYCGTSAAASTIDLGLTTDLSVVDSRVDTLTGSVWNGNTNIEAGMRNGLKVLTNGAAARESADKIMIVMTDGNENNGSAMAAAYDCRAKKIQVHTITFGVDANQMLMRGVAEECGGRHLHANTTQELRDAFAELAARAAQLTD